MTLLRTLPTIWASFRDSLHELAGRAWGTKPSTVRTERDIPCRSSSLARSSWRADRSAAQPAGDVPGSIVISLLIVAFGFFFVTVASRIVGIIGSLVEAPISA